MPPSRGFLFLLKWIKTETDEETPANRVACLFSAMHLSLNSKKRIILSRYRTKTFSKISIFLVNSC